MKLMHLRLHYFGLILIVLCNVIKINAQGQIDSLQQVLKTNISDQEKIDIYNSIAEQYRFSDSLKLMEYTHKAIQLSQKIDYPIGIIEAYVWKGWRAMVVENAHDKALALFEKALHLSEKKHIPRGKALSYNGIGALYIFQANYPQGLEYNFKALRIFEKIEYFKGIQICYNDIGIIYQEQQNYEQALEYYLKALKINQKTNNKTLLISITLGLGDVYEQTKKYKLALEYYLQSAKIALKGGNNEYDLIYIYIGISKIYTQQQKHKQAYEYLDQALQMAQKIQVPNFISECYYLKGRLHFERKNYDKALFCLNQGIELAQKNDAPDILQEASKILAQTHQALGNYQLAYSFQVKYMQLKDSLQNEEKTKAMARLEASHEFEKEKDSLHFVQEKQRLFFEQETKRQKTTQQMTFAGLGLVSILLLVSVIFFLDKRKNNRKLLNTNEELSTANEEIKTAHEELQVLNESLHNTLKISEKRRQKIQDSINYAQRIQHAMLPSEKRLLSALPDHFVFFRPRDVVSGDFYWLGDRQTLNERVIITAVDCTGHGVPGAFMSMVGMDLLSYLVNEKYIINADDILTQLHQNIRQVLNQEETKNQDGMDIALVVWDKKNHILQFSGAKNPLVYVQNGKLHRVKGDKMSIGGEQKGVFTKHEILLNSPITFYLFSDGFQDQFGGEKGRKFMVKRLRQLFFDIHKQPMKTQKISLAQTLDNWTKNEPQIDDILIIGAKI